MLTGRVENYRRSTIEIYKNWLTVTDTRSVVSGRWPRKRTSDVQRLRAHISEGCLQVSGWHITARRGPQNGIYVIAYAADADLVGDWADKALLVGCGVAGYTDPTEEYIGDAIDQGIDPSSLLKTTTLGPDGSTRHSILGFRTGDRPATVVIARDGVPESEWVGVLPESVAYLKAMVGEAIRNDHLVVSWPGRELSEIPWDEAQRANQGDAWFDAHLEGLGVTVTAPGEADDPLIAKVLREE